MPENTRFVRVFFLCFCFVYLVGLRAGELASNIWLCGVGGFSMIRVMCQYEFTGLILLHVSSRANLGEFLCLV